MLFELFVVIVLSVLACRLWVLENRVDKWTFETLDRSLFMWQQMNTRFRLAGEIANIQQAARVYEALPRQP